MSMEVDFSKTSKRLLLLRGAIMLLAGVVILPRPGMAVEVMTIFAGTFIIVDAVLTLLNGRKASRYWFALLKFICGLLCIFRPFLVDVILILTVGFWQIFGGINCLLLTFSGMMFSKAWGIINGILSLLIGIIFVIMPLAGIVTAGWFFGIMLLAGGALSLVTAFALPGEKKEEAAVE